jgi:glycosyltransferase involved in cell wall biosynthesis
MKIIINTPKTTIPAGVANHFLGLKPYFSKNVLYNQYLPGTSVKQKYGKLMAYIIIPLLKVYDILNFSTSILFYNKPAVLLNPSFGKTALKRDAIFLRIAKLFGCKVAVFVHGWDKTYLQNYLTGKKQLHNAYYKADAFFVLANEFKKYLEKLNIKALIHLTTTKVNDQLVEDVPTKTIEKIKTILFLARIEKAKGIFTTIDAYEILSKKKSDLKMHVVGSGNALDVAKEYADKKHLKNIVFTGPLSGEALKTEFINADLYILPTTHGEGMPTSVLEAMAFGLPVITRPVGGLVDFFENDNMGYMIESLNPKDYAEKVELLNNDLDKTNQISKYNAEFAKEHFMASRVAPLLEKQLLEISK